MLDDLNHTIDDVAKEMTSAPANASLARRVAARIADAKAPPRSVWTRPMLLGTLAAVCAIVVAVFVGRERNPVAPTPAPVVAAAPKRTPAQQIERGKEQRTARPLVRGERVAPLPAVEEMNVTPVVVDRVDVAPIVRAEQIEIDPIAITRIEIAPMP